MDTKNQENNQGNNLGNGQGNNQGNNQGNGQGNTPSPPSRPGSPPPNDDNGSDHDHDCPPEPCVPHEFDMTLEIKPIVRLCIAKPDVKIKRNNALCICTPCKDKP